MIERLRWLTKKMVFSPLVFGLAVLVGAAPAQGGGITCISCVAFDRCTGTVFNADGCCMESEEPVCVVFTSGYCVTDLLIGCLPAYS